MLGPDSAAEVAVIIVNFNSGDLLKRCLQDLERQLYPSFRTIVVDNASSDDSMNGIEELHPAVQVIRMAENTGFAEGNNVGIHAAGACKWIACLNPDAFPEPDWLARLMDAAERYPECAFFGSKLILAQDPARLDGTGDVYHVSGAAWRRNHQALVERGERTGGEIFSPCAAAALYRRDALMEVGGFDASYFCYFEDVDLAFRLRLLGHRCRYVPAAQVHHVGSAITGYQSSFTVYHGHRNLVWTYFKNMPAVLFWVYLPQHILLNLASLLVYSFRGKTGVIFKAKWDALRGLGRILRVRQSVQANRRASSLDLWRVMKKGVFSAYWRE